ncbi:hypothetical protein BJX99DRAFT_130382 [Aspergillus californicus]
MASSEPEIILYDLACTKNECFSPVVWRIRLMLNYKRIAYKTIFLEFPDIEPTMKDLGITPQATSDAKIKYTVPVIHHIPSNNLLMESTVIAEFLETTYPTPGIALSSPLGQEIETKSRTAIGPVFRNSLVPREFNVISPRAQDYFRRTREAALGCKLEDLLSQEEAGWGAAGESLRALGELIQTNKAEGPFILGASPSYTDFFIAGSLQCARVVDEGVFRRISAVPGFRGVYDACLPFMEKRD